MKYNGLLFTDLDGTLLNSKSKISNENIEALNFLREHNIACAVCTGRTLNSSREVVPVGLPFDYLIFSSGAGICNFNSEELIYKQELEINSVIHTVNYFLQKKIDFFVHFPIPNNHRFYWFEGRHRTNDLDSKLFWLKDYAQKGTIDKIKLMPSATQLLGVTEYDSPIIDEMRVLFPQLSIIRSTSPLNNEHTWIEVFPKGVSKGKSAAWLSHYLNINHNLTVSFGNDFNDEDMLNYTCEAYIMENSPKELYQKYKKTGHNDDDGFANGVYKWFYDKFGNKSIKHRIITGSVNSGKTTYLSDNLTNLYQTKVDGFICKKTFSDSNNHTGYNLIHINSDKSCPIIRTLENIPSDWNEYAKNPRFSFSSDGFNFGMNILNSALNNKIESFIIDEVAHLEKRNKGFSLLIRKALAHNMRLTLIMRESLIDEIKSVYNLQNIEIINVEK